ncbi:5-formyltetrahydrofolate cyclo-ligase [Cohaesibacter sp. ES.047]|uniref:5-formyltetrahydrofolate cyclo-ligase n=1 Tax=Cohaesibacter sp. ES.047 TaxID=1798205 RepID=UPI000BB88F4B|nr:5-formyltetrahydrofolate cyclo-ligase [Cohaesibacter sp. ES.047]SNY90971.1 5-formyltetrahydrofolate cyclo-ligase [Cohaesibacter sp. ES.047]
MDSVALKAEKAETRKTMRARRDAVPEETRADMSRLACANLVTHVPLEGARIVGLFMPIQSEIDPTFLVPELREKGLGLALPVPIGRTGMMFRAYKEGAELVDVGFGTRAAAPGAPEVVPDLLVMPLLAFDGQCNRIGYGAGHYDRYISERILSGGRPTLVGLAFSFQQLDKVPIGGYDLPLDIIVTDKDVIRAPMGD